MMKTQFTWLNEDSAVYVENEMTKGEGSLPPGLPISDKEGFKGRHQAGRQADDRWLLWEQMSGS